MKIDRVVALAVLAVALFSSGAASARRGPTRPSPSR